MLEACGAYNDVAEEIDVSEANILVTKASKISEGARIVRGLKILEYLLCAQSYFQIQQREDNIPAKLYFAENQKDCAPIMYRS